jgi:hypothetical protein
VGKGRIYRWREEAGEQVPCLRTEGGMINNTAGKDI